MTSDLRAALQLRQLKAWVEGVSYHDNLLNTCVPDFSCCRPHLAISLEEREVFMERWLAGDTPFIKKRCLEFLDALVRDIYGDGDKEFRVHYTGDAGSGLKQ